MKICLCGSTRFMDQFHEANVALSLEGHTVYSVATSTKGDFLPTVEQKTLLDLVHLKKILESDVVVVVGTEPDGTQYLGESTTREIMWASLNEKPVHYWGDKFDRLYLIETSSVIVSFQGIIRNSRWEDDE